MHRNLLSFATASVAAIALVRVDSSLPPSSGPLRRFGRGWNRRRSRHSHQIGALSVPVLAAPMAHEPAAPLMMAVADGLYAGPTAPTLHIDPVASVEGVTPARSDNVEDEATLLPSPTTAVVEVEASRALDFVSAPTGSTAVRSISSAAADYALTPLCLPSPTPATTLPFRRTGARHLLLALSVPLTSPPSSNRSARAGTWSASSLALTNGRALSTLLPGDS